MNETENKSFGQRLAAIRKATGLSRDEFAGKLDAGGESAVLIWESGGCYPSIEMLVKMGVTFGIDIHELLTDQPSPAIENELANLREVKNKYRVMLGDIRQAIKSLVATDKEISVKIKPLDAIIKTSKSKPKKKWLKISKKGS